MLAAGLSGCWKYPCLSVTACSTILLWNVGLLVFFGLLQSCFGFCAGLLLIGCCLMQRWYVVFGVCLQILLLDGFDIFVQEAYFLFGCIYLLKGACSFCSLICTCLYIRPAGFQLYFTFDLYNFLHLIKKNNSIRNIVLKEISNFFKVTNWDKI